MAGVITTFGVEVLAGEVNGCGDLNDYGFMTTIPVFYRLAQGLYTLLNQQINTETLKEKGLAHAVSEAVANRDHTNWEEVATEFRIKHGIPKGIGYGKESE